MIVLLGIILGAVLFAVFALLPVRACDGRCPGCSGNSCERYEPESERKRIHV